MKVKNMLTVGFLSVVGATAVLSASDSIATGSQKVDVINSRGSEAPVPSATSEATGVDVVDSLRTVGVQLASTQAANGEKMMRVDVIDSLPMEWQWDSMKPAGEKMMRVDVIDSVEWRGPVYALTGESMRVDVIDHIRS